MVGWALPPAVHGALRRRRRCNGVAPRDCRPLICVQTAARPVPPAPTWKGRPLPSLAPHRCQQLLRPLSSFRSFCMAPPANPSTRVHLATGPRGLEQFFGCLRPPPYHSREPLPRTRPAHSATLPSSIRRPQASAFVVPQPRGGPPFSQLPKGHPSFYQQPHRSAAFSPSDPRVQLQFLKGLIVGSARPRSVCESVAARLPWRAAFRPQAAAVRKGGPTRVWALSPRRGRGLPSRHGTWGSSADSVRAAGSCGTVEDGEHTSLQAAAEGGTTALSWGAGARAWATT